MQEPSFSGEADLRDGRGSGGGTGAGVRPKKVPGPEPNRNRAGAAAGAAAGAGAGARANPEPDPEMVGPSAAAMIDSDRHADCARRYHEMNVDDQLAICSATLTAAAMDSSQGGSQPEIVRRP